MLALGVFPDVSLKRAREKWDGARQLLADGIDPSAQRKAEEHAERIAQLQTFEAVAREWLKRQSSGDNHGAGNTRRLEQHVFPRIDAVPIADVKRADMREVLRRIERTGRIETAHRVLQLGSAIFEFAITKEICDRTPCLGLSKALPARPTHPAAITDPKQVGELLRAIVRFANRGPPHRAQPLDTRTGLDPLNAAG